METCQINMEPSWATLARNWDHVGGHVVAFPLGQRGTMLEPWWASIFHTGRQGVHVALLEDVGGGPRSTCNLHFRYVLKFTTFAFVFLWIPKSSF